MKILFFISCILVVYANADTNQIHTTDGDTTPITPTLSPLNVTAELANVKCIPRVELEASLGGFIKFSLFNPTGLLLIKESIDYMGYTELRKALDLPPPPPWTHYNWTQAEIDWEITLEGYLDKKFEKYQNWSLDSFVYYEHSFKIPIALYDRYGPDIRMVFRRRFEEVRRINGGVVDRKMIDKCVEECKSMSEKVRDVVYYMIWDRKCDSLHYS